MIRARKKSRWRQKVVGGRVVDDRIYCNKIKAAKLINYCGKIMFHMSYGQIIKIAWANIWHKTTIVLELSNILILQKHIILLIKDRKNVNSSLIEKSW